MFYHQSAALQGLYPGVVTTASIASQGLFEFEIIITPVVSAAGGGGYVPSFQGKPERYRVKVRVKINNVWSEDELIVDDTEARVIAKFRGITDFTENEIMIAVNGIQIHESAISVMINNKRT
jgi:hypothetical protein